MGAVITPHAPAVLTTVSGPPVAGYHAQGELAMDGAGVLWSCSASGTPGAWSPVGAKELVRTQKNDDYTHTAGAALAPIPGLSCIATSRGLPYDVIVYLPQFHWVSGGAGSPNAALFNGAAVMYAGSSMMAGYFAAATTARGQMVGRYRINDPAGTQKTFAVYFGVNIAGQYLHPMSATPASIACVEA